MQVSTSGQHTLGLDNVGTFDGAMLYATFSINSFTFQSIEEVDPVNMWTLLGATGGVLGEHKACHLLRISERHS